MHLKFLMQSLCCEAHVLVCVNELLCCEIWGRERAWIKQSRAPGDAHVPRADDECAPMERIDQGSGLTLQNYTAINCVLSAHPSCVPAFIDEDLLITLTSHTHLTHHTHISHQTRSFSSFKTENNGTEIIGAINKDSIQSS